MDSIDREVIRRRKARRAKLAKRVERTMQTKRPRGRGSDFADFLRK